jgi:hypothetical protein
MARKNADLPAPSKKGLLARGWRKALLPKSARHSVMGEHFFSYLKTYRYYFVYPY